MPAVTPPPYPKSLTTASWDKAKGVIARISKVKTGVTELLKAAEAEYKKAPFADVNIAPTLLNTPNASSADLKKIQDDYLRKYQPQFKKLEGVFYDLSQDLKKKASQFEADEKLKKFAPALTLMANDANKFTYAVAWGTVSSDNQKYLQNSINERVKAEKMWADAAKNLKTMIDKASKAVDKYKSKPPTADEYNAMWKEELRGIGAQIAMASKNDPTVKAKFDAPFKVAAKQWAQSALPSKNEQTAAQIKKDIELLKQFKAISDSL
jgi:hypothetical protein